MNTMISNNAPGSPQTVISHEKYRIAYQALPPTLHLEGAMRLQGSEPTYPEIVAFLETIAEQQPPEIVVDLRLLQFLNSLGISLLSKFVIKIRQHQTIQLKILGNAEVPWQTKSLKNFQRLMPSLILEIG